MDRFIPLTPPEPLHGNFVLLRADTLRLLLPQQDVGVIEHLDAPPLPDLANPGLPSQSVCGATRQVAALSSRLTLLGAIPPERKIVTALSGTPIVWCWNEVRVLIDARMQPRPIPRVLYAQDMPVQDFVELGPDIAFVCSAQRLCRYALDRLAR